MPKCVACDEEADWVDEEGYCELCLEEEANERAMNEDLFEHELAAMAEEPEE
jgi:hypothetical protein